MRDDRLALPERLAGLDLCLDQVGRREVEQVRDLAHEILLVRQDLGVREGHTPERLEEALLLLERAPLVDQLSVLSEPRRPLRSGPRRSGRSSPTPRA